MNNQNIEFKSLDDAWGDRKKIDASTTHVNYNISNGEHYKKNRCIKENHVGQPLDPALICEYYANLSAMRLTALKKILLAGERGEKTKKQDLEDAIGALKREIELEELRGEWLLTEIVIIVTITLAILGILIAKSTFNTLDKSKQDGEL